LKSLDWVVRGEIGLTCLQRGIPALSSFSVTIFEVFQKSGYVQSFNQTLKQFTRFSIYDGGSSLMMTFDIWSWPVDFFPFIFFISLERLSYRCGF
jgi:hypothetical protein